MPAPELFFLVEMDTGTMIRGSEYVTGPYMESVPQPLSKIVLPECFPPFLGLVWTLATWDIAPIAVTDIVQSRHELKANKSRSRAVKAKHSLGVDHVTVDISIWRRRTPLISTVLVDSLDPTPIYLRINIYPMTCGQFRLLRIFP